MLRFRRDARASDGTNAPRAAPERAVHTAERVVRRAWALELDRRARHQEFVLCLELDNCEAVLALLAAAQQDGDPSQISAAHTVVIRALDDVRAAVAARDEARRMLRRELRVLTRKPQKLAAAPHRTLRHLVLRRTPDPGPR
jgi:hypothetical protein